MKKMKGANVYALECMRYPGKYLDAYDSHGKTGKLRNVGADPTNIDKDPWGWFRVITGSLPIDSS